MSLRPSFQTLLLSTQSPADLSKIADMFLDALPLFCQQPGTVEAVDIARAESVEHLPYLGQGESQRLHAPEQLDLFDQGFWIIPVIAAGPLHLTEQSLALVVAQRVAANSGTCLKFAYLHANFT
ncbi:hypothetical protein BKG60_20335 [Mycobacterium syngnathidarum]|uniref:Uncharacterized protein n=1 Tax=Mycobacterium syngnathidarum TaxID=1908205 RepID=A0A1S1JW29_9MYCO|nr:hypothetical protein BKG61_18270 [Mycobacterium syngnathidarum]OLT93264.1 hypothetical protein BKG60_20335 [Mycobacterium syngnathidarum]